MKGSDFGAPGHLMPILKGKFYGEIQPGRSSYHMILAGFATRNAGVNNEQ